MLKFLLEDWVCRRQPGISAQNASGNSGSKKKKKNSQERIRRIRGLRGLDKKIKSFSVLSKIQPGLFAGTGFAVVNPRTVKQMLKITASLDPEETR